MKERTLSLYIGSKRVEAMTRDELVDSLYDAYERVDGLRRQIRANEEAMQEEMAKGKYQFMALTGA